MRKIIIGIVVVVGVVFIGFYALNAYIYKEKQAVVDTPLPEVAVEREVVGIVTAIDLSGVMLDGPALIEFQTEVGETLIIAVPSMGLNLCSAVENIADVYDVVVGDKVYVRGVYEDGAGIIPCEDDSHYLKVTKMYENLEVGFRFEYPKGPDGYLDVSEGFTFSDDPSFLSGVMLIDEQEYLLMKENTEPREGPPTIQVKVYTNIDKQWPAVWVDNHTRETNLNLALSEPQETTVAGSKAVRFVTDGLYAAEVYVVTSGDHVIVIRGEYIESDSDIYRTLTNIINTMEFIPAVD